MLTFYLAAKKQFVIESYRDDAVGFMEKNEQGRLAITRVTLRPEVKFSSVSCSPPRTTSRRSITEHTRNATSPTQ
jgi:hypothetical protein